MISQKDSVSSDYSHYNPDHRHVYKFVRTLFNAAQLTAECAIITLIYLERCVDRFLPRWIIMKSIFKAWGIFRRILKCFWNLLIKIFLKHICYPERFWAFVFNEFQLPLPLYSPLTPPFHSLTVYQESQICYKSCKNS